MIDAQTQVKIEVRCSIILPAGTDSASLNAYLSTLCKMKLWQDCKLIFVNDHKLEIDQRQLRVSLPAAKVLSADEPLVQQQLFDEGAMAASGKYLLLVRDFIRFDEAALDESVNELAGSGDKLSISANKNFVLMENPFYPAKNNLGNNEERVDIFYKEGIRFDGLDISQKITAADMSMLNTSFRLEK